MTNINFFLTSNNRIAVRAPYEFNIVFKEILGGRWNFPANTFAWTFPISPVVVGELNRSLGQGCKFQFQDEKTRVLFFDLLDQYRLRHSSQSFKNGQLELKEIPFGYRTYPPRKSQLQAFWFGVSNPSTLFWMAPGAGKSRVACDLISNFKPERVLIVCLKAAVENVWPQQLEQHLMIPYLWTGDESGSIEKKLSNARSLLVYPSKDTKILVVSSSSIWRRDLGNLIYNSCFDFIIIDEIHKAGDPGGKFSNYLARICSKAKYKYGLSGTAIPDKKINCYSIFRALDIGIFGSSFHRYSSKYFIKGGYENHAIIGYKDKDDWDKKFWSITYFCDESELELPKSLFIERTYELPKKIYKMYLSLKSENYLQLEDGTEIVADNAVVKLLRLHQLVNGYIGKNEFDDSGRRVIKDVHEIKKNLLIDLLSEIDPLEPIVIFYRFNKDLEVLIEVCKAINKSYSEINGSKIELNEWNQGKTDYILVQVQSGSASIDLTRSCYVIYYSFSYSLIEWVQSNFRVLRPPQKRTVRFFVLLAQRTVEVSAYKAIRKKKEIIAEVSSRANENLLEEEDII